MPDQRLSPGKLFTGTALGSYVCLVAIGIAWWVANLETIPAYGDTLQYFDLADSLQVDQYRTLFYPLLLRGLQHGARLLNARVELLVYALQTAAMLLSVAYLGHALWDVAAATERCAVLSTVSAVIRRLVIGACSVVVFTEPLVNHFALSVMTDALAGSFTTAGVAALVRIAALGDTRLRTVVGGWLAIAAAGFMRAEKVEVFALVVALALAIFLLGGRRAPAGDAELQTRQRRRTIAVLAVLLITPSALVLAINRATQTADHGWPAVTVSARLFVRTAWPRLADLRPLLSAETQAVVSLAEANAFDAHYNEYLSLVRRLQHSAGGTDRLVNEISVAALRHHGIDIAISTAADALRYTAPMVAYPLDLVTGARTGSRWMDSRMSMAHPALTRVYLVVATALLFAMQLPLLFLAPMRHAARDPRVRIAGGLIVGTAVMNAVLYALGNGLQNIRYALPAYVLLYTLIVWANAAVLGAIRRAPARRSL